LASFSGTPDPLTRLKTMGLFSLSLGIFIGLAISRHAQTPPATTRSTAELRRGGFLLGISFVIVGGILSIPSILTDPSGADEGMWSNVIRNLVLYSRYALGQPGSFQDFSPVISVGPTVIVPLFILSKGFGVSLWVFRLSMCGWTLMALAGIYTLYARLVSKHRLIGALLLALIFLQNRGIQTGYTTVMGEMPALFFLILGIVFLPSQPMISGLFFGLAIVTKLTLFLILALPFILAFNAGVRREKINFRELFLCVIGTLLPFIAWHLLRAFRANIPAGDNLETVSSFLIFGVSDLGQRILRYGLLNFLKLIFLWGGAGFFVLRMARDGRAEKQALFIYAFSTFFLLWFFFCTDGHFIRYTTYPIFLLIPLAVNALPEKQALVKGPKALFFLLAFGFLFHQEGANVIKIPARIEAKRRFPWVSSELQSKLKNTLPTLWTLEQFDGYLLSIATDPPVFFMREEMFFEVPRPPQPYLSSNPINVKVPQKEKKFELPSVQPGDLLAVGVPQSGTGEKKLYLLEITRVPKMKSDRFSLSENLPEELKFTLRGYFESLGLRWSEGQPKPEEDVYRLEPWEAQPY